MTEQEAVQKKSICQLGFRYGQQILQPAKAASGFDRNEARNPQRFIHVTGYSQI